MLNVRSANYDQFVCQAGACPASCCSGGWQIVIDDESMKLYSSDTGDKALNARLAEAIETTDKKSEDNECELNGGSAADNNEYTDAAAEDDVTDQSSDDEINDADDCNDEGDDDIDGSSGGSTVAENCFRIKDGSCVMLDPDGLCSIQKVMGEEGLCATCNMYPRHMEEFEGVREWSLSLSCPEAARLLLTRKDRLTFIETETEDDAEAEEAEAEAYEEFDNLFYSMLNDARTKIFGIVQDRELKFREKAVQIAKLCDRLQKCIDEDRMFDMDALIYGNSEEDSDTLDLSSNEQEAGPGLYNDVKVSEDSAVEVDEISDESEFSVTCGKDATSEVSEIYDEELIADGINVIDHMQEINYDPLPKELFSKMFDLEILDGSDWIDILERTWIDWDDELEPGDEEEIQAEQLMMFWIYTYFCGASYDGWIYSKAMLAISSTWWILQINAANHLEGGIIEAAYRYAREIEHSDENLNALEEWFMRRE